jgi:RNA polymerase sigma-70 factor (ECF subfamily)
MAPTAASSPLTLAPARPDDTATILRAQRGEREAVDELAHSCRRQAYLLALQLTGDPEEAKDIAQDAMVRFFGSLSRFDAARPVRPWLLRIVRNLIHDRYRRRKVRRTTGPLDPGPDSVVLDPPDPSPGPEESASRHEMRLLVWAALQDLSPKHREIIALRDYQDLSYEEIATALAVPRGTVMSRLHRARMQLREAVERRLGRQGAGREVPRA